MRLPLRPEIFVLISETPASRRGQSARSRRCWLPRGFGQQYANLIDAALARRRTLARTVAASPTTMSMSISRSVMNSGGGALPAFEIGRLERRDELRFEAERQQQVFRRAADNVRDRRFQAAVDESKSSVTRIVTQPTTFTSLSGFPGMFCAARDGVEGVVQPGGGRRPRRQSRRRPLRPPFPESPRRARRCKSADRGAAASIRGRCLRRQRIRCCNGLFRRAAVCTISAISRQRRAAAAVCS